MAVHKATLAKIVNGIVEYVYPKTTSDIVIYEDTVTVYDKLNDLNDSISSNVTAIANLKTSVSDINTNINNISDNVDTNTTDITALKASVNTNIKDIATNLNSITTLQSDLSTAQDKIDYLDENKTDKDYTAEVLYYFNRQSSDYINSGATSLIHGECNIIKAYGKVIMIDTGGYNRSDDIKAYLTEIGVTKVDYLIISHWHMDHCSNFTNELMNYIDWSDCVCYFPVDVPSWMLDYSSATSYKSKAVAYAEANCKEIIYPEEYDELVLNDYFKITFFNCGTSYLDEIKAYQDTYNEFAGYYSTSYSNQYYMNDSSMVCLANHNGATVFYSGDVMGAAQQRIYEAKFAASVDVYKMHHHGVNLASNYQQTCNYWYCDMINPKEIIIENYSPTYYANTTYDINFFDNSDKYQPLDNYICLSSKCGNITHITTDTKYNKMSGLEGYSFILYIDWTQTSYSINEDGSYFHPFRAPHRATNFIHEHRQIAEKYYEIACVILEGDSATGGVTNPCLYSVQGVRITYESWDCYKNNISWTVDEYGLSNNEEAMTSINKYIFRGYIRANSNSQLCIKGIRIAPDDTSFSASLKSDTEADFSGYHFIALLRATSIILLQYCIIDYNDVSTSLMDNTTRYSFANIKRSSKLFLHSVHLENIYEISYSGAYDTTVSLYNLSGSKIKRLACGTAIFPVNILLANYGSLRNISLGAPDYKIDNDTEITTYFLYAGNINLISDPNNYENAAKDDYGYNILANLDYTLAYRSTRAPLSIFTKALNNNSQYINEHYFSTNSTNMRFDEYGARLDLYQLGSYMLNGAFSIDKLVSISEDYYDWDNIKFPGCWSVVGTSRLTAFTNTPPNTAKNGKLICEWIGGSETAGYNTGYYHQTYIDRCGGRFERAYSSEYNYWSKWITITGNMYTDYEDEETATTSDEETTE